MDGYPRAYQVQTVREAHQRGQGQQQVQVQEQLPLQKQEQESEQEESPQPAQAFFQRPVLHLQGIRPLVTVA